MKHDEVNKNYRLKKLHDNYNLKQLKIIFFIRCNIMSNHHVISSCPYDLLTISTSFSF